MRGGAAFLFAVLGALVGGACGGSSDADRPRADAGSGDAAGTSGGGGCSGFPGDCVYGCPTAGWTQQSCIAGQWKCPNTTPCPDASTCSGSGIDCVDQCTKQFYLPTCVNGDWHCISPYECDAGLADYCFDLDETQCLEQLPCSPVYATKLRGQPSQFVGCRPYCVGDAVLTCAMEPDGPCWRFADSCTPQGWALANCAAPVCGGSDAG